MRIFSNIQDLTFRVVSATGASLALAVLLAGVPQQGQAFSLKGLAEEAMKTSNTGGSSGSSSNDAINKGIDSIAGEGSAAILNGQVRPEVALAANQLGIPPKYLPQLQALYDNFRGSGTVTATDVQQQPGLGGWLNGQAGLNAETLASVLNTVFSK